ncbi:hypothetical protein D9M71_419440 [compost metagenome]
MDRRAAGCRYRDAGGCGHPFAGDLYRSFWGASECGAAHPGHHPLSGVDAGLHRKHQRKHCVPQFRSAVSSGHSDVDPGDLSVRWQECIHCSGGCRAHAATDRTGAGHPRLCGAADPGADSPNKRRWPLRRFQLVVFTAGTGMDQPNGDAAECAAQPRPSAVWPDRIDGFYGNGLAGR